MIEYSVIIPTKNRYNMLQRAINSISMQIHPPIEVIVIDNSEVQELINFNCLKEESIKSMVIHAPNAKNAAEVRNIGITLATGRFIAFLDDDDEWLPGKMLAQLTMLEHPEQFIASVCGRKVVSGNRARIEVPQQDDIDHLLSYDNLAGSFSFLVYNRVACPDIRLDETLSAFQDWDFLLRLRQSGRIGLVKDVFAIYHEHNAPRITKTQTGRRHSLARIWIKNKCLMNYSERLWMYSRYLNLKALDTKFDNKSVFKVVLLVLKSIHVGIISSYSVRYKINALAKRPLILLPLNWSNNIGKVICLIKSTLRPANYRKGADQ